MNAFFLHAFKESSNKINILDTWFLVTVNSLVSLIFIEKWVSLPYLKYKALI